MEACRTALPAAEQIEGDMRVLNARLTRELGFSADLSLCIHAGPAVVGNAGHGETRTLTAVGETIDVAQRLRKYGRVQGLLLAISRDAMAATGVRPDSLSLRSMAFEYDGVVLDVYATITSDDARRGLDVSHRV
ncbi:MAG: hypothetical protein ACR2GP_09495 [Burkholderiaceae bacterium]